MGPTLSLCLSSFRARSVTSREARVETVGNLTHSGYPSERALLQTNTNSSSWFFAQTSTAPLVLGALLLFTSSLRSLLPLLWKEPTWVPLFFGHTAWLATGMNTVLLYLETYGYVWGPWRLIDFFIGMICGELYNICQAESALSRCNSSTSTASD